MVILLLLLSVVLILIQQIEFRILYANGQATIEIDYSIFTIILRKDKKSKKPKKGKRAALGGKVVSLNAELVSGAV